MGRVLIVVAVFVALLPPVVSWAEEPHVGPTPDGVIVPTRQLIRPAGKSVEYKGRPVDLVISPNGRSVYLKSNAELLALDVANWTIRQELKLPAKTGASLHGIAISADGSHVYLTASGSNLLEASLAGDGKLSWSRQIHIGTGGPRHESYPCGVELLPRANRALVCLSLSNSLAIVNLQDGSTAAEIPVGVAPFDVTVDRQGKIAYVSNWGGRRAKAGDKTADSAETKVVVDERGIASSGTVGVIDLATKKEIAEIPVGLHPSDLLLSADGKTLYVANANSDTVSVIDTSSRTVTDTISVRPDEKLPFGSMPNALALVGDRLFVANGGNNAIAIVELSRKKLSGFIPAGWYPGGLASDGMNLYVANVKGTGSRTPTAENKFNSHGYSGTVTKVAFPSADELKRMTDQVRADALVPQSLRAFEQAQSDVKPVPVPQHAGEPSVFEHVVYVIKENRTYDQLFGDLPRGNNDPKLCIFGRSATPNQHALAEQFVLLDNYYCNGVCSADGHAWATEGVAVDYLEKSFGDWVRSYPFWGNDPLAFAPSGFIWDNALLHGLSFRDYGEMSASHPQPPLTTWSAIYDDWKHKAGKLKVEHDIAIDSLKRYSCPDSPGWNLRITDQIRADVFLRELAAAESKGPWPNLITLYLPQDHTNGTNAGAPTPAAMVADNDLAVGRCVEAISKSKFWPKTCIFVIEDDPQAGFDHVDGHRSICLAISPYTKRGQTVSAFYDQTSVLHTMELMLGLPPMNQLDAMAPVMRECFTDQADLRPYACVPNETPLDQMNPQKAALRGGDALKLAEKSERLNFDEPDRADEDTLNRVIWHSVKGMRIPYPDAWAGAHGRGLRKLGLKLDRAVVDDD